MLPSPFHYWGSLDVVHHLTTRSIELIVVLTSSFTFFSAIWSVGWPLVGKERKGKIWD
jgi:hypothetical protein